MEQWKPIPGYDGLYEASNIGNIRSAPGKVTSNARYDHRVWKSRIIRPKWESRTSKKKDARVSLWKDGKESTQLVARLVAMAWCDGYSDEMTVNHIDGNPENNCADNLEWVTLSDNIRHAFRSGLCNSFQTGISLTAEDGTRYTFRSMAEASRFLGRANGYISYVLKRHGFASSLSHEQYIVSRL